MKKIEKCIAIFGVLGNSLGFFVTTTPSPETTTHTSA